MDRLKDFKVWQDASSQVFYSLGVGYGSLITYSASNHVKNNCFRDAYICAITNCGTSVYASVVMFSFIGFIANYKSTKCLSAHYNQTLGFSTIRDNSSLHCQRTQFLKEVSSANTLYAFRS